MHQFPQRAFMRSVSEHGVETGEAEAAEGTLARIVERRTIQERGAATGAEKLGQHGSRFGQASRAHRNSRYFAEHFTADAAFMREGEVEQTAERRHRGAHHATGSETGEQVTTREDPPPPDTSSVQPDQQRHQMTVW